MRHCLVRICRSEHQSKINLQFSGRSLYHVAAPKLSCFQFCSRAHNLPPVKHVAKTPAPSHSVNLHRKLDDDSLGYSW